MTIRWRRLLKVFIPLAFLMLLPVMLRPLLFNFDYATCVRRYADGRVENDSDEGCYDDSKPSPIVVFESEYLKRKQGD